MNEKPGYEPEGPAEDRDLFSGRVFDEDAAPKMGSFERIYRIFTSPGDVFSDIARKPTWVAILLLTTLLGAGIQFATLPHLDMEATIRASVAQRNPDLDDEQIEKLSEKAARFAWIGPAASVVIIPIVMLALGGIYLLGIRLAGSETDFAHVFSAMLHAYWPAGLTKGVLFFALLQRAGRLSAEAMNGLVKSNVGAFLPAGAPHWQQALGSIVDVFNLWTFVLVVLGLSIVGGISRKKAGIAAGVLWAFYIAAKVGLAFLKG
ncbi:MAG: YIP1 family protein [Acidobacteria bacterium]|nr:YIP1 family protein [Acidobacteriota bacterium]